MSWFWQSVSTIKVILLWAKTEFADTFLPFPILSLISPSSKWFVWINYKRPGWHSINSTDEMLCDFSSLFACSFRAVRDPLTEVFIVISSKSQIAAKDWSTFLINWCLHKSLHIMCTKIYTFNVCTCKNLHIVYLNFGFSIKKHHFQYWTLWLGYPRNLPLTHQALGKSRV